MKQLQDRDVIDLIKRYGKGSAGGGTPSAHQLDGALHTVSGLTAGHFLKALSPTTFGFAAHGLSYGDVNADAAGAAATVQGNLNTHAALTTTAHGLGASAFHADSYFALAGHNHDGAYDALGAATSAVSAHTTAYNHAHYDIAYGWGDWHHTTLSGYGITDACSSTDARLSDARTPTAHAILNSTYHSDVLTGTITRGDLLYGNATPKIARLSLGTNGYLLGANATDVVYNSLSGWGIAAAAHGVTTNYLPKSAGTTGWSNSSLVDNGTTIYTTERFGIGAASATHPFELYNGETLRTSISTLGVQSWYLSSGVSEYGKISYTTPGGGIGIAFYTGATYDQNRFNLINYSIGNLGFNLSYDADANCGLVITPTGSVGVRLGYTGSAPTLPAISGLQVGGDICAGANASKLSIGTTTQTKQVSIANTANGTDYQMIFHANTDAGTNWTGILFGINPFYGSQYAKGGMIWQGLGDGYNRGQFLFCANAVQNTSAAGIADARFIIKYDGTITIPAMTSAGVVHNNSSGVLSSSALTAAECSNIFASNTANKIAVMAGGNQIKNSVYITENSTGVSVGGTSPGAVLEAYYGGGNGNVLKSVVADGQVTTGSLLYLKQGYKSSPNYEHCRLDMGVGATVHGRITCGSTSGGDNNNPGFFSFAVSKIADGLLKYDILTLTENIATFTGVNVGIGCTPTEALDVVGNVLIETSGILKFRAAAQSIWSSAANNLTYLAGTQHLFQTGSGTSAYEILESAGVVSHTFYKNSANTIARINSSGLKIYAGYNCDSAIFTTSDNQTQTISGASDTTTPTATRIELTCSSPSSTTLQTGTLPAGTIVFIVQTADSSYVTVNGRALSSGVGAIFIKTTAGDWICVGFGSSV
jgi:hypothetical protein